MVSDLILPVWPMHDGEWNTPGLEAGPQPFQAMPPIWLMLIGSLTSETCFPQDFSATRSYGAEVIQATLECTFGSILWRLHSLEDARSSSTEEIASLQASASAFCQQLSRLHEVAANPALEDAVFAMQTDLLLLFGEGKLQVSPETSSLIADFQIVTIRSHLAWLSRVKNLARHLPAIS